MPTFRRTSQPIGQCGLNGNNPITQKIIHLSHGGQPNGVVFHKNVSFLELRTAGQSTTFGPNGIGFTNTAGSFVNINRADGNTLGAVEIAAGSDYSFFCLVDNYSFSSNNSGFFRCGAASDKDNFFIQNGTTRRPWVRVNAVDFQQGSGPQWPSSGPRSFGLTIKSGSEISVYWDGVRQHQITSSVPAVPDMTGAQGIFRLAFSSFSANWPMFVFWDRFVQDWEMRELNFNPWQLIENYKRPRIVNASSGFTGTFASTLADYTMSSSGILTATGTMSATLANFTQSSSGLILSTGTLASTLADSIMSASGLLTYTGSLASTLANATMAASGLLVDTGAMGVTLDAFTMSASGTLTATGTATFTLSSFVMAGSGTGTITGTMAPTLANATMSASGTVGESVFASTMADYSLSSTGTLTATGTLASTLANFAMSSSGIAGNGGVMAPTLANATMAATGALTATGGYAAVLSNALMSAAGNAIFLTGTFSSTLANCLMVADGTVPISGREAIFATLFSQVAGDARILNIFKTTGRLTKHFDDVPSELCPALYLLQTGEDWIRPGKGMPAKRTLECKFIVYTMPDSLTTFASTAINNVLDVIDEVLTPSVAQGAVTLDGLVEHVYVEGKIIVDEGLLQSKSISVIPIRILLP